ncbi:hypothetical protein RCL_jg6539.t1 [Rhizophagus clarus]|uniref:Uncharacterized protein n=1 Tax=Rhizophagus clarus TaxID=94130 RepID=A0A8H3LFU2_9GLOM|nr:hypothetical protein RCL_jg6539.t1 [Rhizophagus clarus]
MSNSEEPEIVIEQGRNIEFRTGLKFWSLVCWYLHYYLSIFEELKFWPLVRWYLHYYLLILVEPEATSTSKSHQKMKQEADTIVNTNNNWNFAAKGIGKQMANKSAITKERKRGGAPGHGLHVFFGNLGAYPN